MDRAIGGGPIGEFLTVLRQLWVNADRRSRSALGCRLSGRLALRGPSASITDGAIVRAALLHVVTRAWFSEQTESFNRTARRGGKYARLTSLAGKPNTSIAFGYSLESYTISVSVDVHPVCYPACSSAYVIALFRQLTGTGSCRSPFHRHVWIRLDIWSVMGDDARDHRRVLWCNRGTDGSARRFMRHSRCHSARREMRWRRRFEPELIPARREGAPCVSYFGSGGPSGGPHASVLGLRQGLARVGIGDVES